MMKRGSESRVGIHVLLLFMALLSLALTSCGSDGGATERVPRFTETACRHTLVPDSTTRCGYLTVPETRDDPDGKTIKIYVGIFKSAGSDGNAPLFYLTGGPGSSTAAAFELFEDPSGLYRQTFGHNRDLIVIDQRGTNNSRPSLYCSQELGPERQRVYGISFREAAAIRIKALDTCYARLKKSGIDLSAYDTAENAADIKDLRDALGYGKINIYSASYGTRLAMTVMKLYPDAIRTVVLDSILPPEVNPFEEEVQAILYSFDQFFEAARSAYPNLEENFYAVMDGLEKKPVNVVGHHYDANGKPVDNIVVNVSGDKVASYLVALLKNTPYDTGLPKTITRMHETGDYTPVADAWISYLDFFFPDGGPGSDSAVVGMYNSVFSAQDAYYTSPQKIEETIHLYVSNDSIAAYIEGNFIYMEPGVLGLWMVEPLPFRLSDPLVSDIPTLMLVGTLDNATPSIFSKPSAAYLSNSFYIEILAGHATAFLPCVTYMIDAFIMNPQVSPENVCPMEYAWL